jgi:hypothetical protein
MTGPLVSRRRLLGATGAVGAGALVGIPGFGLGTAGTAGAQTSDVQALPSGGSMIEPFSSVDVNFQVLFALGAIGEGMAEYGEVATVLDAITAAGSTYDAIHDEFAAMSRRLAARAEASLDAKHPVSARAQYLRAARYMTPPLYFVLGTSDPSKARAADDYRALKAAWDSAAKLFDPPIEPVRIPYEQTSMPGWFLRAPGVSGARPTVILNNGNDAQMADIYSYGGAAALERGYHALIFEGPGQGGMLFLRDTEFRPDWDAVVSPVVDYLRGRDDVDADRIAIIGWSEGGELVAQALTKEHRLAAGVVDPGNYDEMGSFSQIPDDFVKLVDEGQRDEANAQWDAVFAGLPPSTQFDYTKGSLPFGQDSFFDTIKHIQEFRLTREQLGRIDTPMLVTAYEGEAFFAGQAEFVFDALRTKKKLHRFEAADGAQLHDAPMAPQTRNEVVFDWLEATLG